MTVLNWFKSYLSSRSFSVYCHHLSSSPLLSPYGVPQGSVLGPILFILYTTPLSHLISSLSTNHHLYADDTQLFISFCPDSYHNAASHLESVLQKISEWMSANLLTLNPSSYLLSIVSADPENMGAAIEISLISQSQPEF